MSVMGQFCELIASWMRSDQIRVAPTTGRLLSLQVGDRFVLRDEAYVVQSREVDDVDSPEIVIYELGSCLLYTSPSPRDKRQSRMPSSA